MFLFWKMHPPVIHTLDEKVMHHLFMTHTCYGFEGIHDVLHWGNKCSEMVISIMLPWWLRLFYHVHCLFYYVVWEWFMFVLCLLDSHMLVYYNGWSGYITMELYGFLLNEGIDLKVVIQTFLPSTLNYIVIFLSVIGNLNKWLVWESEARSRVLLITRQMPYHSPKNSSHQLNSLTFTWLDLYTTI